MTQEGGRRGVFLDRDGVLNENREDYVREWDAFRFLPGAIEAVKRLTAAGLPIVVVTNQSGVGRGIIPAPNVDDIHTRMQNEVSGAGGRLTLVLSCPHHPDDGCECRKPKPGMLRLAAAELDLDLSRCHLVGDHLSDIDAALAAGCRPILVRTGRGEAALRLATASGRRDFAVADDLSAAVDLILSGG